MTRLQAHLNDAQIGTEVYYTIRLHRMDSFVYRDHRDGDFPRSEAAARETLAIPICEQLTEKMQRRIVGVVAGCRGPRSFGSSSTHAPCSIWTASDTRCLGCGGNGE